MCDYEKGTSKDHFVLLTELSSEMIDEFTKIGSTHVFVGSDAGMDWYPAIHVYITETHASWDEVKFDNILNVKFRITYALE